MRVGVRAIRAEEADLKVIGEVGTVDGLFTRVQQSKPNWIVLDVGYQIV